MMIFKKINIKNPHKKWQYEFLHELELLLLSGATIIDSIGHLYTTESGQLKKRLILVSTSIHNGNPFSTAVKEQALLSEELLRLIIAGEKVNQLLPAIKLCLEWLNRSQQWEHSTRKILSYPLFLIIICLASVAFASQFLLPQLNTIVNSGSEIAWSTHVFLSIAKLTVTDWLIFLIIFLSLSIFIFRFNQSVFLSRFMLSLGAIGRFLLYKDLAGFCHHMSASMFINLNIPDALEQSSKLFNLAVMSHYSPLMADKILQGKSLESALNSHPFIPPIFSKLLSSVKGYSNQADCWKNLAQHCEITTERTIEKIQPLIEPILTLFIGAIILFFIHAVILPLYQGNY